MGEPANAVGGPPFPTLLPHIVDAEIIRKNWFGEVPQVKSRNEMLPPCRLCHSSVPSPGPHESMNALFLRRGRSTTGSYFLDAAAVRQNLVRRHRAATEPLESSPSRALEHGRGPSYPRRQPLRCRPGGASLRPISGQPFSK